MQPLSENSVTVPGFLSKLWAMVNDPATDDLICWSPNGTSFIIRNQLMIWYELLPLYYKHNNMSSFIRQLNIYGFHKMPNVEAGSNESDKDEIQFYHPYFQKDKPELLKNIKRKVTGSTKPGSSENIPTAEPVKHSDIVKVLSDVKQLRGYQSSVDNQLTAMKQENAALWRELALLRQKHIKQQQIVNKLIQFLVTIVQPSTRMTGLGVKRRYPLMLNECPQKKAKTKLSTTSEGPTIHELDSGDISSDDLFPDDIENQPDVQVQSPPSSSCQNFAPTSPTALLEEVSKIEPLPPNILFSPTGMPEELLLSTDLPEDVANIDADANLNLEGDTSRSVEDNNEESQKVFLNPATQDTLLANLINGSYNANALNGAGSKSKVPVTPEDDKNTGMTVATRDPTMSLSRLNSIFGDTPSAFGKTNEDLDVHVESIQNELEQIKDILNGCNTIDANALLGLFSDSLPYGLSYNEEKDDAFLEDPLVSGSELATYEKNLDFSDLFNYSDDSPVADLLADTNPTEESINTPQVLREEVIFPTNTNSTASNTKEC